jgi:hypothetical protein
VAISTIQPYPITRDLVTYKEAERFFAETRHPVSERTMRRWVKTYKIETSRYSGTVYVSMSDLLVAHGAWVAAAAAVP